LAKSLIGLEPSDKTVKELISNQKIKVVTPLYVSKDVSMSKLIDLF